jgi:hypothetical protein
MHSALTGISVLQVKISVGLKSSDGRSTNDAISTNVPFWPTGKSILVSEAK